MKLLPSLKQKKRYVVFEIVSKEKFSLQEIKKAVQEALLLFLGQLGLAKASPMFIKAKGNRFMLKVNHKWTDELITAMVLMKKIKNKEVIAKSVIISGTIKKADNHMRGV